MRIDVALLPGLIADRQLNRARRIKSTAILSRAPCLPGPTGRPTLGPGRLQCAGWTLDAPAFRLGLGKR